MTEPTITITPQRVTVDSLTIRFARHVHPEAPTLLLLSPWPESMFAYLPMWETLTADFSVAAVDLPGFGQSEGRPELMGPQPMGEFVIKLIDALELEAVHAVGPDIGTSTLLFAAAGHPARFHSIQIGGGATAFPLQAAGLLRQFIEAPDVSEFATSDPGPLIAGAVRSIPGYDPPAVVVEDYVQSYSGTRFLESVQFVRSYPSELKALAQLLPQIETPAQILAAINDPYTPISDHEALAAALPHAKLVVLDNGHNAWEETPNRYADLITSWASGGYTKT